MVGQKFGFPARLLLCLSLRHIEKLRKEQQSKAKHKATVGKAIRTPQVWPRIKRGEMLLCADGFVWCVVYSRVQYRTEENQVVPFGIECPSTAKTSVTKISLPFPSMNDTLEIRKPVEITPPNPRDDQLHYTYHWL